MCNKGQNMDKTPVYMIFGSEGILGEAFLMKLAGMASNNRVFYFPHKKADITEANHIGPLMEYVRPSIVINCAAVNDEDICQEAKQGAFQVNCKGPEILAEMSKKYGAKFVHFSSPCVFEGTHVGPYTERHTPKPVNILGQSKYAGEQAIRSACDDHLIIRPGWVFSYRNPSCIPTWIGQAERNEEIAVLDDQCGSPTYVVDLVEATLEMIFHDAKGIFHFANSDAASKESFAQATLEISQLKTHVVTVSQASQNFFKAPMPSHTVLSTRKYRQLVNREVRNWVDALKHCLFNMHRYKP